MESHEVIREAIHSRGPKDIAAEMNISLSLIYKWSQPNTELGSGSRNPLDRVASLMELTAERMIIQWLCERAGGFYIRNPKGDPDRDHDVMPSTNAIVQQFADLLAVITKAANDNSITRRESADIRLVWDELKSFTEEFVRCCEEGDFRKVPPAPTHTA